MDVEWRETTINKLKMITSKLQNYSTHELFRQSQSLPYWMFTPTAVTTKPTQNKFILSEFEHYWDAKWRWNPYSCDTLNIIRPILVECTTECSCVSNVSSRYPINMLADTWRGISLHPRTASCSWACLQATGFYLTSTTPFSVFTSLRSALKARSDDIILRNGSKLRSSLRRRRGTNNNRCSLWHETHSASEGFQL